MELTAKIIQEIKERMRQNDAENKQLGKAAKALQVKQPRKRRKRA